MSKKSRTIPEKKPITFKSPDISKMQEVVIDLRTRIYISPDADPSSRPRLNIWHDCRHAKQQVLYRDDNQSKC